MDNNLSRYHVDRYVNKIMGKLERRTRIMIQLCLADLVLLNVLGEDLAKKLWDKMGIL